MSAEPIICKVTPWYYKRMGLIAAMCAVFAILFFKDGIVGYPKETTAAEAWDEYKKVMLDGYDEAKGKGTLTAWAEQIQAKGYKLQPNGEPEKWVSYAAERGWSEKPKKYTPAEVAEQFYWAYAMVAVTLFCLLHMLFNKNKTLRAEADHFITADGKKVMFADAFRIDKRKWDVKALAYVHYRENGAEKKATIDDLKYADAGLVLERLLANFKGEIIEKVIEEEVQSEEKQG